MFHAARVVISGGMSNGRLAPSKRLVRTAARATEAPPIRMPFPSFVVYSLAARALRVGPLRRSSYARNYLTFPLLHANHEGP